MQSIRRVRADVVATRRPLLLLMMWASPLAIALVVPGDASAVAHGQASASGPIASEGDKSDGDDVGVDQSTGAATLSIPIDLPPGPNGLDPALALSYSSLRGNGLLGVGWSVSLPSVACSTRFGLPRHGYGQCQHYELGGELLVGPDTRHSPPRWHTFTESFDRITHPSSEEWRVTSTSGRTLRFGGPAAARVTSPGTGARSVDTAEWMLSSIEDPYGNTVDITWEAGAPGDTGRPRIARITYAGGTRLVEFVYTSRPDPIRSYAGGVRRVVSERLRELRVSVNGALHHRLVLTYDTPTRTSRSRLRSVQRFGSDCDPIAIPEPVEGGACSALPAAVFAYSDTGLADATLKWEATGAPGPAPTGTIPDPSLPVPDWYAPADSTFSSSAAFLRGTVAQMADVDGDGLVDIVADWPGRAWNEDTLMPWLYQHFYQGEASDPVVMINNGVDGWDLPNGSNASQIWTERIRALTFEIPSITVKQVASFDPQDHPPLAANGPLHDDMGRTKAFGTCVDPGEPPPAVEWKPVGDVQFAGVEPWSAAPHFDATAYRNHTPEMCATVAGQWPCIAFGAPEDEPAETEIRPWPSFQFVDLDGDLRADLVMSVHLSGFHLSFDDCDSRQTPARGQETWIEGAATKVVFMNNGSGWDRDDARDPTDGLVAESLPLFGVVAFESSDLAFLRLDGHVDVTGDGVPDVDPLAPLQWSLRNRFYSSPCDDYGLAGVRGVDSLWVENTSWDFCAASYDLSPVFSDLDGDGLQDVVVTETADPDALFHDFHGIVLPQPDGSFERLPAGWRDSAGVRSVAYLQNAGREPGAPHWVRAEEYDPPFLHARVLQIEGESPYVAHNWRQRDAAGNAQSYHVDEGVRFVDLNRDGLADVVKGPWYEADLVERPGVVLLNTGGRAGDATSSAWCASRATGTLPVCAEAAAYELPVPVRAVGLIEGGESNATLPLGTHRVSTWAAVTQFADLNGDGWIDFITSDPEGLAGPLSSDRPRVFLHQPGAAGSVWQAVPDLLPAGIARIRMDLKGPGARGEGLDGVEEYGPAGYALTDVNGDGVMDFVASDRLLMTHKSSWISTPASARSGLLSRYQNGRGLTVDLTYASATQQRDPAREARAEAHAQAPAQDADATNDGLAEPLGPDPVWPSVDDNRHWTSGPVLASRTVSSPMSAAATTTYRYAQPRRCPAHRADLGFRLVEVTRPDQSRVESYFFQKHGRTGELAERVVYDEHGLPVHFARDEWSLPNPATISGAFVGGVGLFDLAYVGRLVRSETRNEYGAFVGDDPGLASIETLLYDDPHGYNFVSERRRDVPGRRTRTITTPVGVDETYHLAERVARQEVFANQGDDQRLLSRTDYVYHGREATSDPRKVGLRVDRIQARDAATSWDERWTYYAYSAQGNLIEERVQLEPSVSAHGVSTFWCYDGDPGCPEGQGSHSLVLGSRDALGNWRHQQLDPVFGVPVLSSSDYDDEPTTRTTLDSLGRPIAGWHVPAKWGDDVLLSETTYVDFPTAGIPNGSGFQPFAVVRRFAAPDSGAARAAIAVEGGAGAAMLELSLLFDRTGNATAIGSAVSEDPVARLREATEPFACGDFALAEAAGPDAPSSAGAAYGEVIEACAAVPGIERSSVRTAFDARGRPMRVDTPLGFEVFAYGAESIEVVGEGGAAPHDLVLHKDAGGGLQERVLAGDQPVRVRDCDDEDLDPALADLTDVSCESPAESRFVYEPSGELRSRIDPTASPGSWLGGLDALASAQHLTHLRDTLGRIVEIRDPDAGVTHLEFDRLDRLRARVDARGVEVRNEYDALGRIVRIESDDPGDPPTTIEYAPGTRKQRRLLDGPGAELEKFSFYDGFGRATRVVRWIDGLQLLMHFEYDLLDRPTQISYPTILDGAIDRIAYEYDGAFLSRVCDLRDHFDDCDGPEATMLVESVDHDGQGRVTAMHLPGGTRRFTWDGASGRRVTDVFESASGDPLSYRYERSDGPGGVIRPAYDARGNPTHVAATIGSGPGAEAFTHDYTFDGRNRIASWTWDGEATPRAFEYDVRGNLIGHQGDVQGFDVPVGETVDPTERAHAIRTRVAPGGASWTYRYDLAGNLVERSSSGPVVRRFRFDARGRMDCVGTPLAECGLLSVRYRGDGERAREVGARTFYYAGANFRMATVGGALDQYWIEVHALGQRVAYKHVNGGALRLLEVLPGWSPPRFLRPAILAAGGLALGALILTLLVLTARAPRPLRAGVGVVAVLLVALLPVQVWAGGWIVSPRGAGSAVFRWVISDMLGSGQAEFDASGHRLVYETYSPFGRVAERAGSSGVGARRYYAGHDRQLDVGLVYMNSRWMDPGSGTFLSVDPIVRAAANAQSWNGYAYVENNPISGSDPTGTTVEWRIVWTNPETGDSFSSSWRSADSVADIAGGVAGGVAGANLTIDGIDAGFVSFVPGLQSVSAGSASGPAGGAIAGASIGLGGGADDGIRVAGRGNLGRGRRPNPRPRSSRFTPDPPRRYRGIGGSNATTTENARQALLDGVGSVVERIAQSGMLGASQTANRFANKATAAGLEVIDGKFGDQGAWIVGDVLVGSAGEFGGVFLPRTVNVIVIPDDGSGRAPRSIGPGVPLGPVYVPPVRAQIPIPETTPFRGGRGR